MTDHDLLNWLISEIAIHRHMLKQHETIATEPRAWQRATGRIMYNARRELVVSLEAERIRLAQRLAVMA